jgi:hypothetical protein
MRSCFREDRAMRSDRLSPLRTSAQGLRSAGAALWGLCSPAATNRQPGAASACAPCRGSPAGSALDPDVSLAVCSDLSPADRIVACDVSWPRLVRFGPAGFAAYARVRFIPDPTREGHRESEADPDASPDEVDQWRALLELVAAGTEEPDDCYFGLWEGWGSRNRRVDGPSSVFLAALASPRGPTSCFTDHSRRRRSGAAARPRTPGSGTDRSSCGAARPRPSGRPSTRGASLRTSTHTRPGSARPRR